MTQPSFEQLGPAVQKHFIGELSLFFIEHQIITMPAKRIRQNLLFKSSYLNLNTALALSYLNPALNNAAL